MRLISVCRANPTRDNFINAMLYTVFSVSTVINGLTNIQTTLTTSGSNWADITSTFTTIMALISNFLILCREEAKLFHEITSDVEKNEGEHKENIFHFICSCNLNISIITAFAATLGKISHNAGAYGYLYGTWLGQIPELIEPTINMIRQCLSQKNHETLESAAEESAAVVVCN